MEEIKRYRVLYNYNNKIIDNGVRIGTLSEIKKDFNSSEYAIILEDEVPDNWDTMVVVDGSLQTASDSILNERSTLNRVDKEFMIDQSRKSRYQSETDSILFEALETWASNHPEYTEFSAWILLKNKIRQDLPK